MTDVSVTAVDTPGTGKRVNIMIRDRYVLDVEPDLTVALPLDVAIKLRNGLLAEIEKLTGVRYFR